MLTDLKILEKQYEMILWMFPLINGFPQKQRFVLGQQMQNSLLEILKMIIQANQEREKSTVLKQLSVELDKFRYLFRLAKDFKFISIRQYGFGADKINEIGKMLGGWLKVSSAGIKSESGGCLYPRRQLEQWRQCGGVQSEFE